MKGLESVYALFDQLADGVCLANAAGDIHYMNPAAARMLDLSGDSRHLRNACDLLCKNLELASGKDAKCECPLRDPANLAAAVTLAGRHGPRATFNWRGEGVSRHEAWKDLRVRCLRAKIPVPGCAEEEVRVVLIEDASPEAELKRHRADWRSMIAHDLRQPLTCVFSALKLLEEIHPAARGGAASDKENALVETSLRSCRRMMELLDLYLDVAQIDAGATPVKLEPLAVEKVLDDAIDEAARRASDAGVMLELDVEPGAVALADAELFARVAANLLDNAIKYNVKGGSVKLSVARERDKLVLAVKDTGRGIEEKDLPFIFDRYYQAQARRAGRIKGNGLGLTFVKEALGLMGGKVGVESKPGEGTTFFVELAAAPVAVAAGGRS